MSSIEIRVCGRYRLGEKIYKGKYGSVYIGKNVQSGQEVAIKCELKSTKTPLVVHEGTVLESVQGGIGVPNLHWYGLDEDYNFLVTDLLGNSLEDYFNICKRTFSLKTVLMIADQVLSNIEYLHYKGFIHRDIKPENFLMGLGKKLHQIYTIDYANAINYIDLSTKEHVPVKQVKSFYGTLRYASINTHKGIKNSRRDDLQAIGYMLIYLAKGTLPWMGVDTLSLPEKLERVKSIKESIAIEELCEGLPLEFEKYIRYCRGLQYDDKPDYSYLKRIFKEKFISEGYEYDYIYDWILLPMRLRDPQTRGKIPLITQLREEPQSLSYFNLSIEKGQETPLIVQKEKETAPIPKKTTDIQAHTNGKSKLKGPDQKKDCSIF